MTLNMLNNLDTFSFLQGTDIFLSPFSNESSLHEAKREDELQPLFFLDLDSSEQGSVFSSPDHSSSASDQVPQPAIHEDQQQQHQQQQQEVLQQQAQVLQNQLLLHEQLQEVNPSQSASRSSGVDGAEECDNERNRREERLIKNRLSAQSSRERKKKTVEDLNELVHTLTQRNVTLVAENQRLAIENQRLKQQLYAAGLTPAHNQQQQQTRPGPAQFVALAFLLSFGLLLGSPAYSLFHNDGHHHAVQSSNQFGPEQNTFNAGGRVLLTVRDNVLNDSLPSFSFSPVAADFDTAAASAEPFLHHAIDLTSTNTSTNSMPSASPPVVILHHPHHHRKQHV